MIMKQKKRRMIVFFLFFWCGVNTFTSQSLESLAFDRLYPETPVSRVLRTMKQLYATMYCIKEQKVTRDDCSLAKIVEIQSLSVCGALQELDRAMKQGLEVEGDHITLIENNWKALQDLAEDEFVQPYLLGCSIV